jgi:ABC-type phosphate transport system ATPase subunit
MRDSGREIKVKLDANSRSLSGGKQQRLCIAPTLDLAQEHHALHSIRLSTAKIEDSI